MTHELIKVQSNAELDAVDTARETAAVEANLPHMLTLAHHIHSQYALAKRHKDQFITPRLLSCQRQKAGEYDPSVVRKLAAVGGCKDFFNISETKSDALEAWIADVTTNGGELPFSLNPTPIPDLPEDRKAQIVNETVAAYQDAIASGFAMEPSDVYEAAALAFDAAIEDEFQAARAASAGMERKMSDQLLEGGWRDAFDDFVRDYAQYPSAIMKGPILQRQPRMKWVDGAPKVVDEVIHTWKRVSPHLWFPGPNVATPNEGFCCELVQLDKAVLSRQKTQAGWNGGQIDGILLAPSATLTVEQSDASATQALLEGRDTGLNAGAADSVVWGIEYHGSASGADLIEWGMNEKSDKKIEPLEYYDIRATLVGPFVPQCILNPNPLRTHIYKVASFVKVPGSVWGRSMLEKMADAQRGYNNTSRMMMNALAEASRVRSIVDVDALDDSCSRTDYPGKQWLYNGAKFMSRTGQSKPVEYFQATANVSSWLRVRQQFAEDADDRTLVPRYQTGDYKMKGAASTSSGLAMLMGASHKGIKRSLANIDRGVIKPDMQDLYQWNLLYLPDAEWKHIKGDCQIEARGALHLLVKEQVLERRQAFLDQTANPTDMEIIGLEGRAEVLRSLADELHLSRSQIVPDRQTLLQRVNNSLKQQQDLNDAGMQILPGGGAPDGGASAPVAKEAA